MKAISVLEKVSRRYAPSRMLSFDAVHVLVTLQTIKKNSKTSRAELGKILDLGGGSIKTLVKHLKMNDLIQTSNAGMKMSENGEKLLLQISNLITDGIQIPKCPIVVGRYNYAVLVRGVASTIGTGIEQRDEAIRAGASGATTLLYKDGKFLMPGNESRQVQSISGIKDVIIKNLMPENGDVIIIGSAKKQNVSEMAAKKVALSLIA